MRAYQALKAGVGMHFRRPGKLPCTALAPTNTAPPSTPYSATEVPLGSGCLARRLIPTRLPLPGSRTCAIARRHPRW